MADVERAWVGVRSLVFPFRFLLDTGGPTEYSDLGDCSRILERGNVSRILAEISGADHPAHDLGIACSRQIGYDVHPLRPKRFAELLSDEIPDLRG